VKPFRDYLIEEKRSYSPLVEEMTAVLSKTHKRVQIGTEQGMPIYLWESYKPRLLVMAGWQGHEPAGWLACLELAQEAPKDISFLPVACPSAFVTGQKFDYEGVNADEHFPEPRSHSGKEIMKSTKRLVELAKEGCLSLQEDPNRSFGYTYSWGTAPVKKAVALLKTMVPVMGNGVIVPRRKGLFCEHLHSQGVPYCLQVETPADGTVPLQRRIEAQVALVKAL
jgi:hypothetical protein